MKRFGLLLLLVAPLPAHADDNATAWRLFNQGRHAEAAEVFTDPGWKGAALYRSDQWWRAAEAFVRSGDAKSIYNLGNCYAMLGYYELALEAYLAALKFDAGNDDAGANAELMRRLLASKDENQRGGLKPQAREIDRIEDTPQKDEKQGNPSSDNEREQAEKDAARNAGEGEKKDDKGGAADAEGKSGEGNERQDGAEPQQNAAVRGKAGKEQGGQMSAGARSEGGEQHNAETASTRLRLEGEQATEQWLNALTDEPARFLQARIAQEMRRRATAGTLPQTREDAP